MNAALDITGRLIAFAVFLQALEIFMIRKTWSKGGLWNWDVLSQEYDKFPKKFLAIFLTDTHFLILIGAQIVLAAINVFLTNFWISGILLFITILTAFRWRGTFNGGSDYMTVLILLAHFVAGVFADQPLIPLACLWYIALQTVFSYVVAGVAKLKEKSWRDGTAIVELLTRSNYVVDPKAQALVKKPALARMSSGLILVFECTFPLALLDFRICLLYLTIGFLFHLENFFVLGLNRFVFAWLAAYPSLYFLTQ